MFPAEIDRSWKQATQKLWAVCIIVYIYIRTNSQESKHVSSVWEYTADTGPDSGIFAVLIPEQMNLPRILKDIFLIQVPGPTFTYRKVSSSQQETWKLEDNDYDIL